MPRSLRFLLAGLVVPALLSQPLAAPTTILLKGLRSLDRAPSAVFTVQVDPDGEPKEAQAGAGNAVTFTAENVGTGKDTYDFTCSTIGSESCVSVSPTGAVVAPGDYVLVTVNFTAGGVGTSGTVKLRAASRIGTGATDDGSFSVSNVTFGVAVTPDGGTAPTRTANTGGHSEPFTVTNTGSASNTFSFTCSGVGGVTCGTVPAPVPVTGNGGHTTVNMPYSVGAPGTGTLTLTASGANATDQGSYSVPVVTPNPQPPVVDVTTVNPGATIERDLCLTIRAGPATAYECGDLRIVHPLPTTCTLNKARTPTLLYNSAHAHPFPLVAANVTLPGGATPPDSVVATLRFGTLVKGRGRWAGSDWAPGATRRIVVGYDALSDPTGIYAYTLEVVNHYPNVTPSSTVTGELVIVNRARSPFGAGWWLAGLERLDPAAMVWLGGDGSVRRYQAAGTNRWVAPPLDRPDTLKWDGTNYVRYLTHGVRVLFDVQGRHVATVNRLTHVTTFGYRDNTDTLVSVTLPPVGSGRTYQFAYSGGVLQTVTAPPVGSLARIATLFASAARVDSIRDPDQTTIRFGYALGTNRVTGRTDRRGYTTYFDYDAGQKLSESLLDQGQFIRRTPILFAAAESKGLPGPAGVPGWAVDTALAYTRWDGERIDVGDSTLLWLDRFGAPRRIVNALGYETLLTRAESTFPALVTKVRYPNLRVVTATYDGRGNITSSTDSSVAPQNGKYATTRFVWNPTWDFDSIVVPPEGDSTVIAYDPNNGNRLWQQDARGSLSRVTFAYNPLGLISSITVPSVPSPERFYYDFLGNDSARVSPGGTTIVVLRDAIGRDTLQITPVDSLQAVKDTVRVAYDAMSRDTFSLSVGPPVSFTFPYTFGARSYSAPRESLYVRKVYDPNGNMVELWRRAGPDINAIGWSQTRFQYDGANRKVVEIAADTGLQVDSTYFDPADNVVTTRDREGRRVTLTYDALNRLSQRAKASVSYPGWTSIGFTSGHYGQTLPRYFRNGNGGLTLPAETATFTYDEMGNLRAADNPDARIRRRYNLNGSLAADTLIVMPYTGADTTVHVYGLRYAYDLDGRRTQLTHPGTVAPRVSGVVKDVVQYAYHPNGQLATVTDVLGNQFRWAYDAAGRPDTLYYPGLIWEHWDYDPDSRIAHRVERDSLFFGADSGFASRFLHQDDFRYDARGKILRAADGSGETVYNGFTSLGTLARSGREPVSGEYATEEGYHPDALANNERTWTARVPALPSETDSANNVWRQTYYRLSARLGESDLSCVVLGCNSPPKYEEYLPDSSGHRFRQRKWGDGMTAGGLAGQVVVSLQMHYDAGGLLRMADRQACDVVSYGCYAAGQIPWGDKGSFEEYRYDALGRRVLVRSRADTTCQLQGGCQSTIQRTVWDGDQVLYEVRYPGGAGVSGSDLERDTVTVLADSAPYGRVVYLHGPGIDEPLDAIRIGYSADWPGPVAAMLHKNWRGIIDRASFDNGAANRCKKKPDGTNDPFKCVLTNPGAGARGAYFHDPYEGLHAPLAWFGNLITLKRDASGQLYMRNRYYDPNSGQFTQEDPIGLAGGLNLYGFGNGDPMNFDDPFGLAVCARGRMMQRAVERAYNVSVTWGSDGCVRSANDLRFNMENDNLTPAQAVLYSLVVDPATYTAQWNSRGIRSPFGQLTWRDPETGNVYIDPSDAPQEDGGSNTSGGLGYGRTCFPRMGGRFDLALLVAHELNHYRVSIPHGPRHMALDNEYNRRAGRAQLCGYPRQ
jgi:RHS repeat-associated protein